MPEAISNTSPLLYLHRIGAISWLPRLFTGVWAPTGVAAELELGKARGYDVPVPQALDWLQIVAPRATPSEWLALGLGPGELAAMALALENPTRVILLDDMLARRTAQAAGLTVWGTLKVLLEAKRQGIAAGVAPYLSRLSDSGMWLSDDIRQRVLVLADESAEQT